MGNPCDVVDMEIFYACTSIAIVNGVKAPFQDSPSLNGKRLKDIAPLVHEASKRKKWTVGESTYKAQFLGATLTSMNKIMWKTWAPPKVKFFCMDSHQE